MTVKLDETIGDTSTFKEAKIQNGGGGGLLWPKWVIIWNFHRKKTNRIITGNFCPNILDNTGNASEFKQRKNTDEDFSRDIWHRLTRETKKLKKTRERYSAGRSIEIYTDFIKQYDEYSPRTGWGAIPTHDNNRWKGNTYSSNWIQRKHTQEWNSGRLATWLSLTDCLNLWKIFRSYMVIG